MKREEIIEKLEEGKDYIVRTAEEEQSFLDNYASSEVDKRIGDRIGKVYGDLDKDIETTTGKQKPPGVKTYDFLKDILSDYKSRADSVLLMERELTEAKKALREKGSDSELKAQYDNLEKRYNEAIDNFKREKSEMEGKFQKQRIGSMIDNAMSKVKVNKNIPESAVKALLNTTRNELLESAVLKDEELQFKKGDDILVDSTYAPVKIDALLSERLKDILDTGGKTGTGTQPGQTAGSGEIVPPDSAMVSKDELGKFLQETLIIKKGYTKNTVRKSPEYIELYKKYSELIK